MITFLKDNWGYILPLLIVIIIFLRIKIRGFFWETRNGEELTFKEFLKRWGKGIEGITPLQQTKTTMMGIWITLTGIIAGVVVNALIRLENQWWWIEIILVGSLIITSIQMIGTYQKYKTLKRVEDTLRELENESTK
jgi:hypothetical protein